MQSRSRKLIDDLLLECYKEDDAHARHLENQRLEISTFLSAIQVAIVGAIGTIIFKGLEQKVDFTSYIWLDVFLLGMFLVIAHIGLQMSYALIDRFFAHRDRTKALRNLILQPNQFELKLENAISESDFACSKIEKLGPRFRTF